MKKIVVFITCLFLIPFSIKADNTDYTKAVIDVTKMTIPEIGEAVENKVITYEGIMQIYLDRIEAYNKKYNVFITINENALEEAKQKDIEYQQTGKKSELFGLPILVKDNINVVGMPTTIGTKALFDAYPKENAPIVQKLIDAGAIIIGKTNMSEFAYSATNSLSSYGLTFNAYNTSYSSYGSSGGTAVGVAANLAVAGIGTDTGSSIRVPAAANNVVGLRPTYGIISGDGIAKYDSARDTAGPITRYTVDNAILMEIIDEKDIKYTDMIKEETLEGIKIAVLSDLMNPNTSSTDMAYGKTSKEIYDLMKEAIKTLEEKGATIIYVNGFYNNYYEWDATTFCGDFNEFIKGTTGHIQSFSDLLEDGRFIQGVSEYNTYCTTDYRTTQAYKSYANRLQTFSTYIENQFLKYDVDAVVYPTIKTSLFKISELYSRKFYGPSWAIAPQAGMPSINVQIGFWDDLPYGMEILSTKNTELLLYKIAYNYELETKFYENPSISPSLYEIPERLELLMEHYTNIIDKKEYNDIEHVMASFFENYGNIDNIDERIEELITLYETKPVFSDYELKMNRIFDDKTLVTVLSMGLSLIVILTISIIIVHTNTKRKRRLYETKRTNKMSIRGGNNRNKNKLKRHRKR